MSRTSSPASLPASCVAFRQGSLKNAGTVMTAFSSWPSFNSASSLSFLRIRACKTSGGNLAPQIAWRNNCSPTSRLANIAKRSGSSTPASTASIPITGLSRSKKITLGVESPPSALRIVSGLPVESTNATAELVVPKSIPRAGCARFIFEIRLEKEDKRTLQNRPFHLQQSCQVATYP